jgi:hypothetical protein
VFVYSKKLEEVGCTDGIDTYREVFSKQARVVVVLYRKGWGKTKFTGLEESAIKDFCLNNHYKGLVFIKLDNEENPKWLPETFIWIDFELYKLQRTVGAIALRAQEAGVSIREETSIDRAKRAERRRAAQIRRECALSVQGAEAARLCVPNLFMSIQVKAGEINLEVPSLALESSYLGNEFVLNSGHFSLQIIFRQTYGNIVRDVPLECKLYSSRLMLPGSRGYYLTNPESLDRKTFFLDYSDAMGWHWLDKLKSDVFTSNLLAEKLVSWLLDKI